MPSLWSESALSHEVKAKRQVASYVTLTLVQIAHDHLRTFSCELKGGFFAYTLSGPCKRKTDTCGQYAATYTGCKVWSVLLPTGYDGHLTRKHALGVVAGDVGPDLLQAICHDFYTCEVRGCESSNSNLSIPAQKRTGSQYSKNMVVRKRTKNAAAGCEQNAGCADFLDQG